jgi:hypothetical protein
MGIRTNSARREPIMSRPKIMSGRSMVNRANPPMKIKKKIKFKAG